MHKASETAQQMVARVQRGESALGGHQTRLASDDVAWDTWEVLSEAFGASFVNQYGEQPNRFWRYALCGLSLDELRRGIEHVRDSGREYPPSAPVFRALCLTELPRQRAMREINDYQPALAMTADERSRRVLLAEQHVARCREILKR